MGRLPRVPLRLKGCLKVVAVIICMAAPDALASSSSSDTPAHPHASGSLGHALASGSADFPFATDAPEILPATNASETLLAIDALENPPVTRVQMYSNHSQRAAIRYTSCPITTYTEIPTVRASTTFNPSTDATELRKAMKGWGTDEAAIINILAYRTSAQRQQIIPKYRQAYGRDLIKDLKGELDRHLDTAVTAMMTPLPRYLAQEAYNAMKGYTDERTLAEILCTRSNSEIRDIRNAYYQRYGKTLENRIKEDTSGDFESLLVAMSRANRNEANCDSALAKELASQLYKAGKGSSGTDGAELIRILSSYSYQLLRNVFKEYSTTYGSFRNDLKSELSGHFEMSMLTVYDSIQNRAAYFAKELHDSMDRMDAKDRTLIRLIVSRSEIDLGNIKNEYQRMYTQRLESRVMDKTSGYYRKLLLALLGA